MRYLLMILSLLSFSFSEEYIDVLNLNNGDIIKGRIIENSINNYVKIELQGGSILTYEYSTIKRNIARLYNNILGDKK